MLYLQSNQSTMATVPYPIIITYYQYVSIVGRVLEHGALHAWRGAVWRPSHRRL